jgi:prenylcysteine oxidase / farnesylcysteine lyase
VVPLIDPTATQDIDSIHGLETTIATCSLAGYDGRTVRGGNWQIFEQFVERSGAQIFLETEVEKLVCFLRSY